MKKYFLSAIAILIALGCSTASLPFASTPTPQPSPTPLVIYTVIYKSPAEMNLRPGDIPDLNMTDVQNPDSKPLLPDATDQSQRAFKSDTQDISIESDVYILPSITQRITSDIYDLVVPKRRPNSHKAGNEKSVMIGDNATIIQVTDTCGNGYVLIFKRSNVVVVIIGCGRDLDVNFMTRVGRMIDNHITISHDAECAQLNLTPEECANSGTHSYSWSGVETDNGSPEKGWCGYDKNDTKTKEGSSTLTTTFSAGVMVGGPQSGGCAIAHKAGVNTYSYDCNEDTNGYPESGTIVFSNQGFVDNYEFATNYGVTCNWYEEYTLSK